MRPVPITDAARATLFSAFDYTSFFNVWYWVLTIVVWTQICHRTLGVPYDMILRAERLPQVAEEVDAVAAVAAGRIATIHRALGPWIAALGGFALAALAVLGLVSRFEAALAALLLALPLAFVGIQTLRLALAIDRGRLRGRELRRRLARRRAWNQTIAMAAIMVAAFVALFHHPAAIFLRW
jgi:hypothetical protein